MAAYNAEKTIEKAIDSVLEQTYKNFELIVVNDKSSDKTIDIVNKYQKLDHRIKLINNETNVGVALTRHMGVINANGDWIAILDSDDAWEPDKLRRQVIFQEKSGGKLIFTGSAFMDNEGNRLDSILHVPNIINYESLLKQNLISNSSVLVLKSLHEKNEVFTDSVHEDFACWLKILKTGECAYGIDEPLLIYRISSSGKSGNKMKSAIMNWKTYRYIGLSAIKSIYYECWYALNGLCKYKNMRKCK